MKVVPMQRQQLSALAQIERMCFSHPWNEAQLAEELGQGIFLVCVDNARVLGYIGCQTVLDEGAVTNVAVHPDARRRGVGKMLLRALLEHARAKQIHTIFLEVRPSNTAARQLYQNFGFYQVGIRPHFYQNPTEDALLLQCVLSGERNTV